MVEKTYKAIEVNEENVTQVEVFNAIFRSYLKGDGGFNFKEIEDKTIGELVEEWRMKETEKQI